VKTLNYDLKRLPKDREAEYKAKVDGVKKRIEKTDRRYRATVNGEEEEAPVEDGVSVRSGVSGVAKKKKKKRARKQVENNEGASE
jgi:hypothetical protein